VPITIVSQPGTTIGPGVGINLRTDLIGPISPAWTWRLAVVRPTDEQNIVVLESPIWSTDDHEIQLQVDGNPLLLGQTTAYGRYVSANTNDNVNLTAQIVDDTGAIHESGALGTFRWDTNTSSSQLLGGGGGGGLTPEQADQLAATERRTQLLGEPGDLVVQGPSGPAPTTLGAIFSRSTLDRLTLFELTAGETCEPVRANFASWFSSVIVRVTTIDPTLTPKTPDNEWYFPDLAVLRVFRGGDLYFRRGIHTPTFFEQNPWEWGWQILNQIPILGAPPDLTVAVDWRPGCCGRVFLVALP
jgi:hypothetical protein